MKVALFVILYMTGAASLAIAAQAEGPPPLPPEAYAACESKAEGDACMVQIHEHEVHGKCAPDREGKGLFCRPEGMPPAPPPPPDGR